MRRRKKKSKTREEGCEETREEGLARMRKGKPGETTHAATVNSKILGLFD
jgi:hypothetical protein